MALRSVRERTSTAVVLVFLAVGLGGVLSPPAGASPAVSFADPGLEQAIREAISKPQGSINAADLAGLTTLDADNRGIRDLAGIQHCTALERLRLGTNGISDLAPLAGLANLRELILGGNQIGDLSPLAGLAKLERLVAYGNRISTLAPLDGLANLRELILNENQITDLSALSDLVKLETLWISENQIADISPLRGLRGLRFLILSQNRVRDIASLSQLSNPEYIYLDRNLVTDVSPLSKLRNLKYLLLQDNQIADVSAIAQLGDLKDLNLGGNLLTSIQPLVQNTGLGAGDEVHVELNYLDLQPGSQAMADVRTLIGRGARVTYEPQRGTSGPVWRKDIEPGDILYDPTAIGGLGHAGIYVGNGLVVDPQWDDCVHAIETWDSRTEVYLLRVNCPLSVRQAAADQAWAIAQHEEYHYDWRWYQKNATPSNTWWYCSELVWAVYWNQGINIEWNLSNGNVTSLAIPVAPGDICKDADVRRVSGHCRGAPGCCESNCPCGRGVLGSAYAFLLQCPADLIVTDPDGLTVGKLTCTLPGAVYFEGTDGGEADAMDVVYLPTHKPGPYSIEVVPDPGAAPSDTYTVKVRDPQSGEVVVLADDVPMSDAPSEPYRVLISAEGGNPVRVGDVTEDGVVNVLDARLALQIASGLLAPTQAQRFAADVDQDGDVDVDDARILADYVVGIRSSLP